MDHISGKTVCHFHTERKIQFSCRRGFWKSTVKPQLSGRAHGCCTSQMTSPASPVGKVLKWKVLGQTPAQDLGEPMPVRTDKMGLNSAHVNSMPHPSHQYQPRSLIPQVLGESCHCTHSEWHSRSSREQINATPDITVNEWSEHVCVHASVSIAVQQGWL